MEKHLVSIGRSMELAAALNAKEAIKHDPSEAKETAAQIHHLAANLAVRNRTVSKADQYKELEERIRQQGQSKVGTRKIVSVASHFEETTYTARLREALNVHCAASAGFRGRT